MNRLRDDRQVLQDYVSHSVKSSEEVGVVDMQGGVLHMHFHVI